MATDESNQRPSNENLETNSGTNSARSAGTSGDGGNSGAVFDEFLDNAGHELRTPITALKAQIQLIQRRWSKIDVDANDRAAVGRMLYHVDRLNYHLQVFLDAAHITKGNLDLLPAGDPFDLVHTVDRMARSYRAGNPSTVFSVTGPDDDEEIANNWDLLRVETILSVLLANAVRYGQGKPITLAVTRQDGRARVEVSDEGIGVPPEDRERIFEPYVRGSNATGKGVGLGLSVARALAQALGGDLGMEPRPEGGSTFWLHIPLSHYRTLRDIATGAK